MNNLDNAIKDLVWKTISKYYNVDRNEPRVLTYKQIMMDVNPIDILALTISDVIQQITDQAQQSSTSSTVSDTDNSSDKISVEVTEVVSQGEDVSEPMHDDYSEGDYSWSSYGFDPFD